MTGSTGFTEGTISILIADSSQMGCELLAKAFHDQFHVVGAAVDSRGVMKIAQEQTPSLALISEDLADGPLAGFRLLRELRAVRPKMPVIMLLNSSERDRVIDAFRGGAHGIFCRSDSIDRLRKCIRSVHKGQIWANSRELQFLLEALAHAAPLRLVNAQQKNLLTKREEEVVRLVSEGLTNREISKELKLSEHTVKNYIFRVFEKLGVSSRVELTLYALSQQQMARQPGHQLFASSNS